jgi:hypothetical protein
VSCRFTDLAFSLATTNMISNVRNNKPRNGQEHTSSLGNCRNRGNRMNCQRSERLRRRRTRAHLMLNQIQNHRRRSPRNRLHLNPIRSGSQTRSSSEASHCQHLVFRVLQKNRRNRRARTIRARTGARRGRKSS